MKLALPLLFAALAHAQTFGGRAQYGGAHVAAAGGGSLAFTATNTQITVSYDAPDSGVCTVAASEDPSGLPLVHDVDTTLFANANRDDRDGAITTGTHRVFVLGQRLTALASDAKLYSRALQAYTRHYVRVSCGATVMTGSVSTANIPINSTYQDQPQLDRSNPGTTIMPTPPTTRTPFIDPHTGAKIMPVSLASDIPYDSGNAATFGPFLFTSGAPRVCANSLGGPGPGYICKFSQGDGGPETFQYIIPSTGEARYLGRRTGVGSLNAIDGKFYGQSGGALTVSEYDGDYSSGSFSFTTPTTIIANILGAIQAFAPSFNPALFPGCGIGGTGDYLNFQCLRGDHDSYGWVGAIQISTASVVAAMRVDSNERTGWCVEHQVVSTGYDQPMFQIIPHEGVDGGLGQGPYLTTLTGNIDSSVTTINVAGEPGCVSCGADAGVALAKVGDVFRIGSEAVKIVTKTSSTIWVVTRGARSTTPASHSSGDNVTGSCDQTLIHWKFLDDPHGTDTTNTSYVQDFAWNDVAGHNDATTGQLLSEAGDGWVLRLGDLMTQVGQPYTRLIPSLYTFGGKNSNGYGNSWRKHPSVGAPGSGWFSDFPVFDYVGTGFGLNTWVNVTGSLYKATVNLQAFHPKHYAIAGVIGSESSSPTVKQILDVSPASIGGSSGDNYKACMPMAPGECYSGSAVGDLFVNVPGSISLQCENSTNLCIANFGRYANGVAQIGTDGAYGRVLTSLPLRNTNDYPTSKTLADGSWMLYATGSASIAESWDAPSNVLMVKLPPFTADDSVDRSTFIPGPIPTTTPGGLGIATAEVEFGYLEQGTMTQHYCTSRREACVAVGSAVNEAAPFYFQTAETYTRLPCVASCTPVVPVLPGHTAYYRVKFYDGGSPAAFVRYGNSGILVEGTEVH